MNRAVLLVIFFWSCKGDPGPTGGVLTGNIAGSVYLVNASDQREKDASDVTISLDKNGYSTTSLSNGSWQLDNVSAGIYDVTFSKPGYFTEKLFNMQFVGGGTLYLIPHGLYHVSASVFSQLAVTVVDSTQSVSFQGSIVPNDYYSRYVYIFVSRSYLRDTLPMSTPIIFYAITNGKSTIAITRDVYYFADIASRGDTLYATGCLGGFGNPGINYDPATGWPQFDTPNVTFSNTVRFVLP